VIITVSIGSNLAVSRCNHLLLRANTKNRPAMENVLPDLLPYLLTHRPVIEEVYWGEQVVTEWCPGRHFRDCHDGPDSRNDCACCRARMLWIVSAGVGWINATPVCDVCCSGWTLTTVSRNWLHETRLYARAWKRCYCGWCDGSWFRRGWICEGAVQIEVAFARRGNAVRGLMELSLELDDLDRIIDYWFRTSRTRRIENYGTVVG